MGDLLNEIMVKRSCSDLHNDCTKNMRCAGAQVNVAFPDPLSQKFVKQSKPCGYGHALFGRQFRKTSGWAIRAGVMRDDHYREANLRNVHNPWSHVIALNFRDETESSRDRFGRLTLGPGSSLLGNLRANPRAQAAITQASTARLQDRRGCEPIRGPSPFRSGF
jgi:hypothetical protein